MPPWDLTDAIDSGRTAQALDVLHRMTRAGERHPLALLSTLHTHYARMLRLDGAGTADEAAAAVLLGMKGSTFPAKKALTQARRLGSLGVAEAIRLLAEADLDLRGFERVWPDELVLEVLVARLSRLAPPGDASALRADRPLTRPAGPARASPEASYSAAERRATRRDRRLLLRAAAFLWITPLAAALSIRLTARRRASGPSSVSAVVTADLTRVFSSERTALLLTRRFSFWRLRLI